MRLLFTLAVGVGAALLPRVVFAQEGAFDAVGGGVGNYDAWDWFGLGVRLGAVLIVILLAVMAMRWYVRRTSGGGSGNNGRRLQVLETRALGPNRSLHLIRLGNRAVLLGVTPERINQLLEINEPEEVERLAAPVDGGDGYARSIRSIVDGMGNSISRLRTPRRGPTPGTPPVAATGQTSQQLRAEDGYRRASITELQSAIERSRQGAVRKSIR